MDKQTLFMGIVFSVGIFGPLAYLIWFGKKRNKRIKKALNKLARKHQLTLNEIEAWNDKALGVDKAQKKLLYVSHQVTAPEELMVDLTYVTDCKVSMRSDVVKLLIEMKKPNWLGGVNIVLFDVNHDDPVEMGYHYQIGKKWVEIIENVIRHNQKPGKRDRVKLPKAS